MISQVRHPPKPSRLYSTSWQYPFPLHASSDVSLLDGTTAIDDSWWCAIDVQRQVLCLPLSPKRDNSHTPAVHTSMVMNAQTPEDILIQLRALVHSVRKEVKMDGLQAAITSLQGAIDAKLYLGENRAIVQCHLVKALLTRYGIHGWIIDLDTCNFHLASVTQYAGQWHDGGIWQVQNAAHLIQESRSSLRIFTLNTIIRTAEAALSSFAQNGSILQVTELLLILGNALVMRFLRRREAIDLCHASASFQHAKDICRTHPAHENLCLTSLAFAEWLRVIEWGQAESITRMFAYQSEAVKMDEESSTSLHIGMPIMQSREAITKAQLQEAITSLSTCLRLRMAPHPRRLLPLHHLANAFLTRYEWHGDLETLNECIILHREGLSMRPVHHPFHSTSLTPLAAALFYRFERNGVFSDLEESIMLRRECFALKSANDPSHRTRLKDLGRSLFMRFERQNEINDLEEAITFLSQALSITPQAHVDRPSSLRSLANAFHARFREQKRLQDLDQCIILHREALELQDSSNRNRPASLANLADALHARFEEKGDTQDFEECVAFYKQAIDAAPAQHPAHHHSLQNLAMVLSLQHDRKGNIEDLEKSIELLRRALIQSSSENRSGTLLDLAGSLFRRFEKLGDSGDIEESIKLNREALDLLPPQSPDRVKVLNNLATTLLVLFQQSGKAQDLDECITHNRESMILQPASSPTRYISLNSLANALFARFEQKGVTQDLQECIELHRQARNVLPAPSAAHPALRSTSLVNLANALIVSYQRTGSREDLEESITVHREALGLLDESNPSRPRSLNSLANALLARHSLDAVLGDIEECINLHREALTLRPVSHPNRCSTLNNLGLALHSRFQQTGNIQDIDECILLYREALDIQLDPHPSRQSFLTNLAEALQSRFDRIGELQERNIEVHNPLVPTRSSQESSDDDDDLVEALRCYEEGAKYDMGSLITQLNTAKRWASCAWRHGRANLTLDACRFAMELLPQIASLELTLSQRQDVLRHSGELVGNAVRCAASVGRFELAIVFLSTGRSVFWSQALQLRTPVDELATTHAPLATEFISISRQLERASYTVEPSNTGAHWGTGGAMTQSLSNLTDLRRQIIDKIRKLPDYQDFLLPPSFSSLRSAAKTGPIVFLNASVLDCDALIMHVTGPVQHIPLPTTNSPHLMELKELHALSEAGSSAIHLTQDRIEIIRNISGRDINRDSSATSNETIFCWVLNYLWMEVVSPIVEALNLHKTNTPGRIWWCPTGPFTSLPIHAAGIYSADNEPIDCIFQYTISSYCTSPQDLLRPEPQITPDFRMTVIIEPDAPGAAPLPATREELRLIEEHVPHHRHLITHVGEGKHSNNVETLISDIQQSPFVHFGCHGMQHPDNPLESYLLLSGSKLTMSRIISDCEVPRGALAYLSACETAKGDEIRPDESLNLVATMIFAGFRSVVGTMWSIYDIDAPIVADVFYRHLFRNREEKNPDVRDAAHGLHLATQELRDLGRPFCSWVPYVHYGI